MKTSFFFDSQCLLWHDLLLMGNPILLSVNTQTYDHPPLSLGVNRFKGCECL